MSEFQYLFYSVKSDPKYSNDKLADDSIHLNLKVEPLPVRVENTNVLEWFQIGIDANFLHFIIQ